MSWGVIHVLRKLLTGILIPIILLFGIVPTVEGHWPVARRSHISQTYRTSHKAIDICAPCGSRIYPALDGNVVFAGWRNNGGGWQVWVSHGSGRYTAYYHMRYRPRVVRGTHVHYNRGYTSGTVIGYIGSTGWSIGCHIHIEYWHGYPWRSGSWRSSPWQLIDHGYWYLRRY